MEVRRRAIPDSWNKESISYSSPGRNPACTRDVREIPPPCPLSYLTALEATLLSSSRQAFLLFLLSACGVSASTALSQSIIIAVINCLAPICLPD